MAADMAVELKDHNVASISLWPGTVKTELVMHNIKEGMFEDYHLEGLDGVRIHKECQPLHRSQYDKYAYRESQDRL